MATVSETKGNPDHTIPSIPCNAVSRITMLNQAMASNPNIATLNELKHAIKHDVAMKADITEIKNKMGPIETQIERLTKTFSSLEARGGQKKEVQEDEANKVANDR